jgi:two-component system, OmpR family, Ni(II)-sensor and/or redox sensor kinase NrsS
MFARARRRLTLAYLGMSAIVIVVFSIVFVGFVALVLTPSFDVDPDASNDQAAQMAYDAAVARMGVALVAADVVALGLVGLGAWFLAARTLRPIGEAHERQRRFVADASHEMRTPLAAIRATTEQALLPGASAADQHAALEVVAGSAERLGRLTADLLLLAQGDTPGQRQALQPADLSMVVAEHLALRATAGLPRVSGVHLATGLEIDADADEVGRICDNLVDNAFRYGGPAVHVRIATRALDHEAVLEVRDDGPGISSADQARIFEPFFRVHPDAAAAPGSGLGLAIAAALAKRHGGRLTVASRPGQGTIFRLSLPRST